LERNAGIENASADAHDLEEAALRGGSFCFHPLEIGRVNCGRLKCLEERKSRTWIAEAKIADRKKEEK